MLLKIFDLAFLVGTVVSGYKYSSLRVVASRTSTPDEFPFIVSIQTVPEDSDNGTNIIVSDRHCTGSVIAPTWILTACHCFDKDMKMRVRFGDMTVLRDVTSSYRNIIEKVPHPSCKRIIESRYKESKIKNDIALALIEDIPIRTLGIVSAAEYSSFAGVPVVYAGFWSAEPKAKRVEETAPLQVGLAGVVPCGRRINFMPVMCIVAKCSERVHPNLGDSGGPLLFEGKIVGVISGPNVDKAMKTWVARAEATPVSPYLDWILYTVKSTS